MKKLALFVLAAGLVTFLQFCGSSKKAASGVPKVTYAADVQPIITKHCSPCHIPPQGNKEALHTYDAAKSHVDSMIARIQLDPGQKGFMPFRHPKLPDSVINVFVRWKETGLAEK